MVSKRTARQDESSNTRSTTVPPLNYAEKLELVFRSYERTLDLETALTLVPLSTEERRRLVNDPELAALMSVCRARTFERIIVGMNEVAEIKGERAASVRLTALKELGRVLRPDKFKERVEVEGNITYVVKKRKSEESDVA